MALRSSLGLWAYTAPSVAYLLIVSELGELVDALEITTVAPGGFGDLAAVVKLSKRCLARLGRSFGLLGCCCCMGSLFLARV